MTENDIMIAPAARVKKLKADQVSFNCVEGMAKESVGVKLKQKERNHSSNAVET